MRRGGSDVGGSLEGRVFEVVAADVSADGGEVMKSSREGPALRRSWKVVVGRRVAGLGSGASVANEREEGFRTKEAHVGR